MTLPTGSLRARLAKRIVKRVAICYDRAIAANYLATRSDGQFWKDVENMWGRRAKDRERFWFPVARWLDKEAMVDEMVNHGYWG